MNQPAGRARAWGWVAHLSAGGTQPWSQWHAPSEPIARVVPGAQQLELLRRINLAAAAAGATVEGQLVERVLRADAPGRGLPDLELLGAEHDARFGAPAIDPATLSSAEIARSAAHLVATDLVSQGPVPRPSVRTRGLRRSRDLRGDPWMRSELTRELTARGRAPRRGGRVVVVGADLPTMLADAWTQACFDRPVDSWDHWLSHWGQRPGLPPGLNLGQIAHRATEELGARRVRVVLDERDLPRALGVASLPAVRRPGRTAAELARRVGGSLSLMIPVSERSTLLREGLLPRLPPDIFDVDLPRVGAESSDWVAARGARMAEQLAAAGYPVRMNQSSTDVATPARQAVSDADGALDLAVRLLLGHER